MKIISLIRALGTASLVLVAACATADTAYREIPISEFADAIKHWNDRTGETDAAHYALTQIPQIADNILRYQRADGGWPSNKHPTRILSAAEQKDLAAQQHLTDASFDNRNIYPQINYLARAYQQTGDSRYRDGALRGIDYILKNQYKNGGWPHTPASSKADYHHHMTFADDGLTGLLKFLRHVKEYQSLFNFVPATTLANINNAIQKIAHPKMRYPYHTADYDIKIIHDPDAEPVWARSYDLQTQQRFFANRDGEKMFSLADVHHERRTDYRWYGTWSSTLFSTRYPAWRAQTAM